jgi:predicted HTH domain antitoxin
LTLLDGFEALAARLLKVPLDDFERVLKKERVVFERAREQRREEVDEPAPDA